MDEWESQIIVEYNKIPAVNLFQPSRAKETLRNAMSTFMKKATDDLFEQIILWYNFEIKLKEKANVCNSTQTDVIPATQCKTKMSQMDKHLRTKCIDKGINTQEDYVKKRKCISKSAQSEPIPVCTRGTSAPHEEIMTNNQFSQTEEIARKQSHRNNHFKSGTCNRGFDEADNGGMYLVKGFPKNEDFEKVKACLSEKNFIVRKCKRLISLVSGKPLKHVYVQIENPKDDLFEITDVCGFAVKIERFRPRGNVMKNRGSPSNGLSYIANVKNRGKPGPASEEKDDEEISKQLEGKFLKRILCALLSCKDD